MVERITGPIGKTHTMIRTRIRPAALAVALAAAATVAIATGPMTPYAQAKPKTTSMHDIYCQLLQDDSNSSSDKAQAAYQAGNVKLGSYYSRIADADYTMAVQEGCAWAIW